ncbi:hypothetical protein [Nocardioides sp. AE5]|nr:hypothetical protein [Nocardioides sp. AE5]MDT0202880.1 hypothetical protein [Nocardioides sp. AE5]
MASQRRISPEQAARRLSVQLRVARRRRRMGTTVEAQALRSRLMRS